MRFYKIMLTLIFLGASFVIQAAPSEYQLVIKDHRFEPVELIVPSGERVKITIDNQDPTPEEFESHALHREKIIPANSKASVLVGPLEAGRYKFVGEFHEETAQGVIVVQ